MDPGPERLVTNVIRQLIQQGVLVWSSVRNGFALSSTLSNLAGFAAEYLIELLFRGGRRINNAIRNNSDNNIVAVVVNELKAMALESVSQIIACVEAVIAFLKRVIEGAIIGGRALFNRSNRFVGGLEQRALEFTSISSTRRN